MRHSFIILCVFFSLIYFLSGCSEKELETNRMTTQTLEQSVDSVANEEEMAVVTFYICGQVKNPGVYTLPEGSRVEDAIVAAGGTLEEADLSQVNLARCVKEEEQITIYAKGEAADSSTDDKIHLNYATKEQLMTLTGIGESKALEIIAYRKEHGGFQTKEELMNISGIKEGTYNKIKDEIVLD
ncbi:MAG: helix-hairpin-helix domain-containing protein [Lachnospiraceae bacterium]|nr:helix-hairpin-helix domain-containing protein [Lachnospiraceae bacterium]